jgi:polyhydroxyalkanoate synthesis regulator phasin
VAKNMIKWNSYYKDRKGIIWRHDIEANDKVDALQMELAALKEIAEERKQSNIKAEHRIKVLEDEIKGWYDGKFTSVSDKKKMEALNEKYSKLSRKVLDLWAWLPKAMQDEYTEILRGERMIEEAIGFFDEKPEVDKYQPFKRHDGYCSIDSRFCERQGPCSGCPTNKDR